METPSANKKSGDAMYWWLREELSKLHVEVLKQPLPPKMMELVRRCEETLTGENDEGQ